MARTTHVKSARALYHTKPVLNDDGTPKIVPVTNPRTGEQKVTKTGRPVTRPVTERDLTRPKPNLKCDFEGCQHEGKEIRPGQAYKFKALRFRQINRHEEHPEWQVWEYSSSISAQAARLQSEMHDTIDAYDFSAEEDFDDLRTSLAEEADAFASEREEALENMPEQLQEGSQASEYAEAARSWADDFGNVSAPDDEVHPDCETCEGSGKVDNPDYDPEDEDSDEEEEIACEDCDGEGKDTETISDEWSEAAKDALREAVDALEI